MRNTELALAKKFINSFSETDLEKFIAEKYPEYLGRKMLFDSDILKMYRDSLCNDR